MTPTYVKFALQRTDQFNNKTVAVLQYLSSPTRNTKARAKKGHSQRHRGKKFRVEEDGVTTNEF